MKDAKNVVAALATVVALVCARQARADVLVSTRGEPLVETAHVVDVEVADGIATMVVERTFENKGSSPDQVELEIVLPDGAVATGMRIKGQNEWYGGELMEAQMASVVYESLTGYGPWEMKDPAILFWSDLGTLGLWMFPVNPGTRSTVEYTLVVPVQYRDGKNAFSYPALVEQSELALPGLAVVGPKKAKVWVDGKKIGKGQRVSLGTRPWGEGTADSYEDDDQCEMDEWEEEWSPGPAFCPGDGMATVEVQAPPIDTVSARYGAFALAGGAWLVRLEIDAAKVLRLAPVKADVVFVVDGSRSFGESGIAAAVELARAYAALLPDARYEMVIFRHGAARVLGDLVEADAFDEAMKGPAGPALEPGNGSHLDEGLRLAASILAKRKGPKRIVAITDSIMRSSYSNELSDLALEAAGEGLVVHVLELVPGDGGYDATLERMDDHDLAPVPLGHGGIAALVTDGGRKDGYLEAARELVRPLRIDGFVLGNLEMDLDAPPALPGGRALRYTFIADTEPQFVKIEGLVWAERFDLIVPVDQDYSYEVVPALLFSSEIFWEVDEKAQMSAAAAAGAVSPMTSYLCVEPGVRPSIEGIDYGSGEGTLGVGSMGSIGYGYGAAGISMQAGSQPDYAAVLSGQAGAAIAHCTGSQPQDAGGSVEIEIETTWREIVDVGVRADDPALGACVEAALWGIDLDPVFEGKQRFDLAM